MNYCYLKPVILMVGDAADDTQKRNIKHKYHTSSKEAMTFVNLMDLHMHLRMNI